MGSELAEVTAALRDLQDQVQHLTRAVEHLSLVVRDRHHSPPRASTAASAVGSPYRAPSATSTSSEYNALAREIPPIPDGIRALASALRSEAGARAERAWTIGYWARFCLAGRIRSPRPSPPCKHSNCIYVVLKAPGFACPLVCTRRPSFLRGRPFGAEQGFDDVGDPVAIWRRSIVGCAVEFLRLFPRIKGVRRQNAVADRAIQQIRSFLFAGCTERIEEVEACSKGSCGHPCSCFDRLLDGHLLGKVRWLRRMSRVGVGPILPCSHLRCSPALGLGRCEGTPRVDNGGGGTGDARFGEVGFGLPANPPRGSAISNVGIQVGWEHEPSSSGFRPTLSSKVGDDCSRLSEGGGLHPESQVRPQKASDCSSRLTRCRLDSVSQEKEESKGPTSRRSRGAAAGQVTFGRGGGHVSPLVGAREVEFENVKEELQQFGSSGGVPFAAWVSGQVRRILASKTAFSFYVVQAMIGCRGGRSGSPSTALFPIPLPSLKVWDSSCGRGQRARLARAYLKLLHLVVLALNFEYLSQPLSALPLLWRPPGLHHLRVYERLLGFIRASAAIETIGVLGCGRKSLQFGARIEELLAALTKLGVASATSYGGSFAGGEVPLNNEAREELIPYSSLDPTRLKLTGRGQWHCDDYLNDLLWLVFREPRINRFSLTPPEHGVPDVSREDPVKVFDLCRLWDQQGLLVLCPEDALKQELQLASRVFNCRKSALVDRQIGDRRSANSVEGKLSGESKWLPAGPNLLQLQPVRFQQALVGACTDRKDYYHQFATTWERSTSNFLLPSFTADSFRGFAALKMHCSEILAGRRSGPRERLWVTILVEVVWLFSPQSLLCWWTNLLEWCLALVAFSKATTWEWR